MNRLQRCYERDEDAIDAFSGLAGILQRLPRATSMPGGQDQRDRAAALLRLPAYRS